MTASSDQPNPLLAPLDLGWRQAQNRIMFGPHETNLADGRTLGDRHVAYYRERAAGGAAIIVTEEASVHDSDWPYERCPSASEAGPGWEAIVAACRPHGALVMAALGHSGGQGSAAFHQRPLWAPSDEPEVNSREVPKIMEAEDIEAVIAGFGLAARAAAEADVDGVEINVGQHSLIRQFLSGLTNRRGDDYGNDRALLLREVLAATRAALGPDRVLGLRLSCDEMAPWAGVTPDHATELVAEIADDVDYLVVVRGSIFTVNETRPTLHHGEGFNLDLVGRMREAAAERTAVFAQGSIVDVGQAAWALEDGRCDGVEMTRAQIADSHLVVKLARGETERIRPCVLCNQMCKVRDNRNPIVGCIADPRAGHETSDPNPDGAAESPTEVLVVGGGPAGLEAARVAAGRGHRVRLAERSSALGGMASVAAHGPAQARLAHLVSWLEAECRRSGVTIETGADLTADALAAVTGTVILATGSLPGDPPFPVDGSVPVISAAAVLAAAGGAVPADGDLAIWDPIGGPTGVAVAELLAAQDRIVHLLTPDAIAGNMLALSGDLAGSNVRLQQAGVHTHRRVKVRSISDGAVTIEHVFTAEQSIVPVTAVIDAGSRLPNTHLADMASRADVDVVVVGDAVAPRTVGEAIREGRQAALRLDRSPAPVGGAH